MKNGVRAMMEPSAMARFRMSSVVMDCLRARARMLQMTKRFPGTPRRKTRLRMRAPIVVEILSSTMVSFVMFPGTELLMEGYELRRAIFVTFKKHTLTFSQTLQK